MGGRARVKKMKEIEMGVLSKKTTATLKGSSEAFCNRVHVFVSTNQELDDTTLSSQ